MMMKVYARTLMILLFCAAVVFSAASSAFAIGEFAIGLNAGVTYDPNNLEDEINQYNLAMETYADTNAGASASQMTIPYAPVFGFNVRYQFNFFFFRLGCHFSNPIQDVKGSVTSPGGVTNTIKIKTFQSSYPATIGILVPLNRRTHFYIGAGPTLHQVSTTISQSDPTGALQFSTYDSNLSSNKQDRYSSTFVGYHFIVGAEVPVHEKFTLSVEWIHQEGVSPAVANEGIDASDAEVTTPKRTLRVKGDFLMFGLNYYISF
ncbi:MAG TPA: outer membrane beta-barrel protein [Spirochaetota bacterium]|nr:outer membrane beta-barrel protein [Spirochaetota bacterium]HPJ39674.1 outer membrane beta-barrel protein [Spirochaetota bacterium]HPQ53441.1 outer membrane beta-barrel protein [Spirochaetota bacterium]